MTPLRALLVCFLLLCVASRGTGVPSVGRVGTPARLPCTPSVTLDPRLDSPCGVRRIQESTSVVAPADSDKMPLSASAASVLAAGETLARKCVHALDADGAGHDLSAQAFDCREGLRDSHFRGVTWMSESSLAHRVASIRKEMLAPHKDESVVDSCERAVPMLQAVLLDSRADRVAIGAALEAIGIAIDVGRFMEDQSDLKGWHFYLAAAAVTSRADDIVMNAAVDLWSELRRTRGLRSSGAAPDGLYQLMMLGLGRSAMASDLPKSEYCLAYIAPFIERAMSA